MTRFNIARMTGYPLFSLFLAIAMGGTAMADGYADLLESAQSSFRDRQYEAARDDAAEARQSAQTPREQMDADLLLAQILVRLNQNDAALDKYQAIIDSQEADDSYQARARQGMAGVLMGQREYVRARRILEPVLTMDVPASQKNNAQRDLLRTWWGFSDWRTPGDLDALKQAVQAIIDSPEEAWPGRHVRALQDAGNLARRSRAFPQARWYYEQILEVAGESDRTVASALRNIAGTYEGEGDSEKARDVLDRALQIEDLPSTDRANALRDLASTYSSSGEYSAAREVLKQALALNELSASTRASILADLSGTHLKEYALEKAASVIMQLLDVESAPQHVVLRPTSQLVDMAMKLGAYDVADDVYTQLVSRELSDTERQAAYSRLARIRMARGNFQGAQEALTFLAESDGRTDAQRLTVQLQMAGTVGAAGQLDVMRQRIDQAMSDAEGLPVAEKIQASWDAAQPLFAARQYAPARMLLAQADRLAQQKTKSYAVRSVDRAPADAGAWLASGLLDDPDIMDARFYPYSQQDAAALLAVDVTADRPFGDPAADGDGPGETSFAMVYDTKGWHIYVHCEEPLIDQIMAQNGEGGSSLEMFFTPGVDNEPYYQWIIRLATGEVSIYDWSTPNRDYRSLQSRDNYFKVQTTALEDGWGVAIFISWEMFHDQLPHLADQTQPWRFSMQRWDPSGSVTWGGRVHETGRWGHLLFEPSSEAQRIATRRHLVKRSWWHYQSVLNEQATFWSGSRGDEAFFRQVIEPMTQAAEAHAPMMDTVDEWDTDTLNLVFETQVPFWQDVQYIIDDQRHAYLHDKLLPAE